MNRDLCDKNRTNEWNQYNYGNYLIIIVCTEQQISQV